MKTNNTKSKSESELQNRIAQSSSQAPAAEKWRGVFLRGPQSAKNKDGEEIPVWSVFLGDNFGEPVRTVYGVYDFQRAESLARVMSEDRKLSLINEAQPA